MVNEERIRNLELVVMQSLKFNDATPDEIVLVCKNVIKRFE